MTLLTSRVPSRRLPVFLSAALFALGLARLGAVPAFPGAEGFGANASGGRGGTVYHVTTLNDSGPGSFRDAVSVSGRTVVFDVGGIIVASSPIVVKANITIAGQTAPGGGITVYGDRLSFSDANNTLARYLRFREGINGDSGTDGVGAASGNLMMFDHISASWGRDETFSLSGTPSNITLQDCIIGQGLLIHSAGSLMQTSGGISIFRCLYIDNWMRNPKVKGVNDFQNNVVYNWGSGGGYIPAGDSAGLSFANLIGNYFIGGPNTGAEGPFKTGNANYNLYHANNFQDLDLNGALDGTPVTGASFPTLSLVAAPFAYAAPATLLTAQQAYAHIMANAGASLHRDHADTYMLAELVSLGTAGAQIFNESEIGGVGTVAGGVAAKDTDGDGMPDWWEEAAGANPLVADNNGDLNGDGYTNLENYLNALAPAGVPAVTIDGLVSDTGSLPGDGITSDGTLLLNGSAAPGATVTVSRVDTGAIGLAVADGTGHWTFDYTGTPLADRYYAFMATVALPGGQVSPPTRAFVVKVDTAAAATPAITSIVLTPAFTINGTSEPGSLVNVTLVGTGVVATATADPLGAWSAAYTGAPLAPGVYSFTAAATDLAGNGGAASAPYVIDTGVAAPVFLAIATDTGASAGDQITNDPTLILNGTSVAGAIVTLTRVGVGVIGSATTGAGGAWSFNYTAATLPAGTTAFTATAATGGSSSPASPAFNVTVDTTRPTIVSIRRQNPASAATTGSTLVYRVTFAEPVSGVDAADFSLTLSAGVTAAISSLSAVSGPVYEVTVTGATGDGTVRLDLKSSGTGIVDVAGNTISGGFTAGQPYTLRLPGSGVWISDDDGQVWSNPADWENGLVANGAGATADFSTRDLTGGLTVQLDSARTLGRVVFGDSDFSTTASWTLSDNGSAANTLTLAGANPSLQVDGATTPTGDTVDVPAAAAFPANLDVVLAGSGGFTKTGVGTLQLVRPATISGPLTITKGIVQIGVGGSLAPASVSLATSQQLRIAGGTFSTAGNVTWSSGTGTGIIVSAGTATFQRILPSNTRNSFFRVTGGTVTATEITFPRSGDSEVQAIAAGIFVSGGDTTVGTIGLGTADSWGSLAVSGGKLTVTGVVNNGFQATSGRGGVINNSGGEFNVLDSAFGLVMSRNPNTATPAGPNQPNNVSKLTITGGVSNLGRLTLGYSSTSSAGSATVSLSTGELNLGAGGIVKNGASGLVSTITLNSGTLGAYAPWSTAHPIVIAGTPATLALRGASATGATNDFALNGVLSGAGGFAKTGAGTVTLAAANSFTGDVAIAAGTLAVNGSLAAGGSLTVQPGGTLAGAGTINRAILLDTGGAITPAGALAAGSLTWNGGGTLAIDLGASGASDQLVLGTLAKGAAGSYAIALNPGPGFAVGNTYTVATFGSTTFAAGDFVATGLPADQAGAFTLTANSLQLAIVGTPSITGATTAMGTYGVAFNHAITAANGPTSFSASGLPAGLSLDLTTGVISGSPAAVGTFNVTLGATNLAGTGTAPFTLTVMKAAAAVTLGDLSATYNGTPRAATAVTAPAGLAVGFTYDGSGPAPTNAGSYAVAATVDSPFYFGDATGTLVIAPAAQTITFPNPGARTFGEPPFALDATATSGLSVSYTVVSGPATISGNIITLTGAGTIMLRAAQAGDANYLAALPVDVTFTVGRATATVTLANLLQTYDGTPKTVTTTTAPAGLAVHLTYDGDLAPPVNAGTYAVVATIDDANYVGSATEVLTISQAAATVTLGNLNHVYDGTPKSATATTAPAGLAVLFSYDGVPAPILPPGGSLAGYGGAVGPTLYVSVTGAAAGPVYGAGAYAINSDVGTAAVHAGVLTPGQAAVLAIQILPDQGGYVGAVQNGVTSLAQGPAGGSFHIVGIATSGYTMGPVAAGATAVVATVVDPNYAGTASGTLTIAKATPVIAWVAPAAITYGTALGAAQLNTTASTPGTFVFAPAAGTVLAAGADQVLSVAFAPADGANFENVGGSTTITVNKALATVSLGNLSQIYNGAPRSATATTNPAGLMATLTYNGSASAPTNTGNYAVVATIDDTNYSGSAAGTLVISRAGAIIALDDLVQAYDGTPKAVTVITSPENLAVAVTYNGSATLPKYPGSYAVVATITDANHTGSASGTLVITVTALVRHAPTLDGSLDGSMQILLPENTTLNGSALVSGDLLVPGTPTVQLNGHPVYGGTLNGTGSASPSNYTITLNGSAALHHVVRRMTAIAMPTVAAPPAPAGTRNVSLNNPGQSPGAFATLRNLTLNGNGISVAVPAGTYGAFTLNGNNVITLGVAGASGPAVYNLQSLTLNGSSRINVIGPVVVKLASGTAVNGAMGAAAHPEWLELKIASGGLTLNSNVVFDGYVTAPNGTITINGNSVLNGGVVADRLTINGNGALLEVSD